jgi:hypothetical protein
MSCYAPTRVKTNQERFPRRQHPDGRSMEILSPFSEANMEADSRAFAAFMRRLAGRVRRAARKTLSLPIRATASLITFADQL